MRRLILYLLAGLACGGMLFGWGYRRGVASVEVRTMTRIDTVFFESPRPFRVTEAAVAMQVPQMLFAPRDTIYKTVLVAQDSMQVEVPVRTLEYRDSTYYARVSGPMVGELGPRLDWIETYNRTVTRTVMGRRNAWEIGPAAGAWFAPQGGGLWVGGQVRRNFGRLSLSGSLGYDTRNAGACGQVALGVAVWRK